MSTKYNVPGLPPDSREYRDISVNGGEPVKVYKDGSIEATSFVDTTSDDLYYEKFKDEAFYFGEKLDNNTEVRYFPKYIDKVYKTIAKKSLFIQDAFALLEMSVRKLDIQSMDRFHHLPRRAKKRVKKLLGDKKVFHFTRHDVGGSWALPYVESNTFGPYNCDVKIVADSTIEMINDLIVVKTGSFHSAVVDIASGQTDARSIPGKETIVYVSPHVQLTYDIGLDHYTYTGDHVVQGTMPTGAAGIISGYFYDRLPGVTNVVEIHAPSSKFITIDSGVQLQDGHPYYYADSSTQKQSLEYDGDLENTLFGNVLGSKVKDKVSLGTWNGVIPSGAYFRIESWSTNPKYAGFDGKLKVISASGTEHEGINFYGDFSGDCMSKDYLYSVRNAITKAEKKGYRKFNDYLQHLGLKPSNNRKKRYDRMIERIAQNIYGGVSIVNNTQLGANQGTVSNPWDSFMYYDGSSMRYGGSLYNHNYDYRTAPDDKIKDAVAKGTSLTYSTDEVTNSAESNPFENYTFTDAEMANLYTGTYDGGSNMY